MKFPKLFDEMICESLDTRIIYNPTIINAYTVSQNFSKYNHDFEIRGELFNFAGYQNILSIEFRNVKEDSYEVLNNVKGYPGGVYGIALNWASDAIHSEHFKNEVEHLLIAAQNNLNDRKFYGIKSTLYKKIKEIFLRKNPEFQEDAIFENTLNSRANPNGVMVFAVSKKESA